MRSDWVEHNDCWYNLNEISKFVVREEVNENAEFSFCITAIDKHGEPIFHKNENSYADACNVVEGILSDGY